MSAPPDVRPLPERSEPYVGEPSALRDLSGRDWRAVFVRAGKRAKQGDITDVGAALAFFSFMSIPSGLLVFFGTLGLFAPESMLKSVSRRLASVGPGQAQQFLGGAIERLGGNPGQTIPMIVVGFLLGLWSMTGAMTAFMRALNRAYERHETRGFVRQRVVALEMLALTLAAFALVFGLTILGPKVASYLGDVVGGWVRWTWWVGQWPILFAGLAAAFATVLVLGPNVEHPRWRFVSAGSLVAVVVWLVASILFAVYTSRFGSYNQTWGSLSAVIIMLTWLWLTAMALVFGGYVNVEAERSRGLRTGKPAERPFVDTPPQA